MAVKILDRLKELQDATKEYTDSETERLQNEVLSLKAILEGRLAGKGLQENPISDVTQDCYVSIQAFLAGEGV
jgi:hypothetical protein